MGFLEKFAEDVGLSIDSNLKEERFIQNTLRKLARQRVLPSDHGLAPWYIVGGPKHSDPRVVAALRTCHLRGWVEVVTENIPIIEENAEGIGVIYRVTEGGWQVLHRLREWVIATFIVAFLTLLATIIGIIVSI